MKSMAIKVKTKTMVPNVAQALIRMELATLTATETAMAMVVATAMATTLPGIMPADVAVVHQLHLLRMIVQMVTSLTKCLAVAIIQETVLEQKWTPTVVANHELDRLAETTVMVHIPGEAV